MARYHLYSISGGVLIGAHDIEAGGDNEAARIAEQTGRGDHVEIWDATSRVRIVRPGGAQARGQDAAGERPA
ncbi:MAG: hypothetical protein QOG13_2997 [Sphingomonadales bacterium]|jgi:hypothetical protein|nr:hypothetical protein [Sphingomonadales bacterium]MEA3045181.1 hypothetical protein [Sphingomonadales bacterium]